MRGSDHDSQKVVRSVEDLLLSVVPVHKGHEPFTMDKVLADIDDFLVDTHKSICGHVT